MKTMVNNMNKTAERRFKNAAEIFKTVLLILLVISLVLLVAVYISGMKVYENIVMRKNSGESFDKLWSVQSGTEPEPLDGNHLIPEFISYKQSTFSEARGCVGDSYSVSGIYELVKPCILELFGNNAVCRQLTADHGAEVFGRAVGSDEFIYIRYHVPVLYQLIYAFAADALTVSESDVAVGDGGNIGAYVSELIIIPDKDFAAHRFVAYAHDGNGGYYEFRPAQHIVTSSFYISKLADGAANVDSYKLDFIDGTGIITVDGEIECDHIHSEMSSYSDNAQRNALLRLFKYNPDKLDWYTDEGVDVYIDSSSQLRIGEGSILFSTSDATDNSGGTLRGIEIDTLLGYSVDGTPGLFDKMTAVDNLLKRLGEISPSLIGGAAVPCLGDVYVDGELLTVEYFLAYDNIRVGKNPYFRAVLTENTVCEAEIYPVEISMGEDTVLAPRPNYILRQLSSLGKLSETSHISAVRLIYTDGAAEWTVIAEK